MRSGDRLVMTLGVLLSIVHRCGSAWIAARLQGRGLGAGTHAYLLAIADGMGRSQDELARYFHVDKANVSRALGRLERAGLVHRAPGSADRRANRLALTVAGRRLVPVVRRTLAAWDRRLRRGLSATESRALEDLLRRVAAGAVSSADA